MGKLLWNISGHFITEKNFTRSGILEIYLITNQEFLFKV